MLQDLAFSAIRIATPLIFASMGGLLTFKAGILNIALDGFMIVAAFAAVVTAYLTGSLTAGILAGVISSMALAGPARDLQPALPRPHLHRRDRRHVHRLRSDGPPSGGIARPAGHLHLELHPAIPRHDHPRGRQHPPDRPDRERSHTLLVYVAYVTVPIVSFLLYRTQWGLRVRIVGESEAAAAAAGVNVDLIKVQTMLASGFFCGLAGAYLSLGYVSLFAKQMTNDRGLIAVAAIIFAKGNPYATAIVALLFGLSTALSIRLPDLTGIAPQLLQMLPYLVTVLAPRDPGCPHSQQPKPAWKLELRPFVSAIPRTITSGGESGSNPWHLDRSWSPGRTD